VTQVDAAAPSPRVPLREFVLMYLRTSVSDFAEGDGMMYFPLWRFLHASQRDPAGFAPRIDLECERL